LSTIVARSAQTVQTVPGEVWAGLKPRSYVAYIDPMACIVAHRPLFSGRPERVGEPLGGALIVGGERYPRSTCLPVFVNCSNLRSLGTVSRRPAALTPAFALVPQPN
jgi:hypothetical protein